MEKSVSNSALSSYGYSPFIVAGGVATLILLSLIFVLYSVYSTEPVTPEGLFEDYFHVYQDVISKSDVRSKSVTPGLTDGMKAYNVGRYDEAKRELKSHSAKFPEDQRPYLYLAISHTMMNEFVDANRYYLLSMKTPDFRQQAQWYQSLSYLKSGEIEQALKRLKDISLQSPFHYKKVEASQLLNALTEYRDNMIITEQPY